MIYLHTGNPGAGKTARAVDLVLALLDTWKAKPAEKRPIIVVGISEFSHPDVRIESDPNDWEKWPDGSIVIIDEAQVWWPSARAGEPIPPIKALSKHRHRGFDFHLTTQKPTMLNKWIRGLVETHFHYERKFLTTACKVYRWDGKCVDDVNKNGERKSAITGFSPLPKRAFAYYKSASMHVAKKTIPKTAYLLVILPVVAVLLFWLTKSSLYDLSGVNDDAPPKPAAVRAPTATQSFLHPASSLASAEQRQPKSAAEWIAWQSPRIPGIPWSAPMYDGLKPSEMPQVFCAILVDRNDCRCMTEQGSRWDVTQVMCKRIATDGMYNPYRSARNRQGSGKA